MILIEINNQKFFVKSNISVLEACKYVGITIPRFCYHETLSVAGNCRMCLVEIGNSPKPVASCALPALNNMKIFVDTPLVKKARENVLELLLLNHPLDCPICDQGGECDLQDQTKIYGGDYSRFFFNKRGVENKNCGPLIKTVMTRCIHCTRCVRFGIDVSGVEFLGTLNRGEMTEIGSYAGTSFNSEISGNVIDLCPVGALTSKPYAFRSRPWELRTCENVDITDSSGSSIYVHFKESKILRVIPKINRSVNDNIISDKARFSYDAITNQRLEHFYSKLSPSSQKYIKTNAPSLVSATKFPNTREKRMFFIDSNLDLLAVNFLKQLSFISKGKLKIRSFSKVLASNFYSNAYSTKISNLNKMSTLCLIVGCNIRLESAILNNKIRAKYLNNDFTVFGLCVKYISNFNIEFVNLNILFFLKVVESKIFLCRQLIQFKFPIFFLNESLSTRGLNVTSIFNLIKKILPTSCIYNVGKFANSEGLNFLNVKTVTQKDLQAAKQSNFIDTDNIEIVARSVLKYKPKKVQWFNTHGSKLALKANNLFPLKHFYEEEKILVNLEQRPQRTSVVMPAVKDIRSLTLYTPIFSEIETKIKHSLFLSFLIEMSESKFLFDTLNCQLSFTLFHFGGTFRVAMYPFKSIIEDFYLSNKNLKYSKIMAQCSQEYRKKIHNFL